MRLPIRICFYIFVLESLYILWAGVDIFYGYQYRIAQIEARLAYVEYKLVKGK